MDVLRLSWKLLRREWSQRYYKNGLKDSLLFLLIPSNQVAYMAGKELLRTFISKFLEIRVWIVSNCIQLYLATVLPNVYCQFNFYIFFDNTDVVWTNTFGAILH